MTWTSARNKAASTVIIVQRKMPGAKTIVIMMIIKIITNSCIISYHIIQPLSQGLFSHCKTFLKLLSFAFCAQDFFLIYHQCQFVPYKLKFARSGIWLMPLRSPWPWGKDTRIKCSYSIFLVFAIFVFLPSNNFGATNRAWHGLGLMRQKCGCIYQGIILKYLFAKTKCWKYFRSPSNRTKAADTFNFVSTFIVLLLTSGFSK